MSHSLLAVRGMRFAYRNHEVLRGVELTVHRGESVLLLGQNGAGKTTLLSCILGLLPPTAGDVTWTPRGARLGGFISNPTFLPEKSGMFQIEYEAELRRRAHDRHGDQAPVLSAVELRRDVRHFSELLNFDMALLDKRTGIYSTGMLKKLALLKALVFRPDLLILDEPTSGLDPLGIRDLRDCLNRIRDENRLTLIQSSHQINEARRVATRALILSGGRIKRSISLTDGSNRWRLRSDAPLSPEDVELLEESATVRVESERAAELVLNEGIAASGVLRRLVQAKVPVAEFSRCGDDLEGAYLESIAVDEE